jgi:hypothetical protein
MPYTCGLGFFKFLTKVGGKKDLKSVSSSVIPTGIFGELLIFSISRHGKGETLKPKQNKAKSQHRKQT